VNSSRRWHDGRTFRIGIDLDFNDVLRPLADAVESKLLFKDRTSEVDGSSIRHLAEHVDELTNGENGGMGGCFADGLTHGASPSLCYQPGLYDLSSILRRSTHDEMNQRKEPAAARGEIASADGDARAWPTNPARWTSGAGRLFVFAAKRDRPRQSQLSWGR
jgi:hypothetical protein